MSVIKSTFFSIILLSLPVDYVISKEQPDLLLANVYAQSTNISQYWVSEKYDGVRAYWDGKRLVSRQGNTLHAPQWFIANFPNTPLDGELWIGRGKFEQVLSTISKDSPIDSEWERIVYMVFELPNAPGTFTQRLEILKQLIAEQNIDHLKPVPQFKLSSQLALKNKLDEIIGLGGEGLMLHRANALYHTGRSNDLLKVKTYKDAEATVIRHLPGKGKYIDMLGSIVVEDQSGKCFKIGSGFSDKQRADPPPIGSVITYKYYGLTKNGIPRFASFLRIRKTF